MVWLRSDDPPYAQTFEVEPAWEEEAVFTRLLMHEPARKGFFHKIDLFHTITLGVGKSYAASSLTLLQELCRGSSIEERMREISAQFIEYCKDSCSTRQCMLSSIPAQHQAQ